MRKTILFLLLICIQNTLNAQEKVGLILPLTGDFAYFGSEFRQGFEIGLNDIKNSGQTIPEIIYEDDQCLAKSAVNAFQALTNVSKVSMIIGPACSASIQSTAAIAENSKLPILLLLDAGPRVAALPDPIYTFGFDPSKMADHLAKDMVSKQLMNIALITEDEEYAISISDAFKHSFKSSGGEIITSETVPVNSKDLQSLILKVLRKKPQALFFSSAYESGNFIKRLRLINKEIPVYGNDTMCVKDTIVSAGKAANDAICGNVILDENLDEVKSFIEKMKVKDGKVANTLFYAALGHDSAYLMFKELGIEIPLKLLLGVGNRNPQGVYDVESKVLRIRNEKLVDENRK